MGCYIDNLPSSGAFQGCLVSTTATGPLILTNMYFTELNLSRLSNAFRIAEKYVGTQRITYNNKDPNFLSNLAVPIDIHRYADELCIGYPLLPSDNPDEFNGQIPNQRKRFCSFVEYSDIVGATSIFRNVDEGSGQTGANQPINNNHCIGTQIFGFEQNWDNLANNDGQMLSQFVFQSRFDESIIFDENNIKDYYTEQYNRLLTPTGSRFKLDAGSTINQTYKNSYTDTDDNITRTYEDLIALARKYDICCVPVFPSTNDEFL